MLKAVLCDLDGTLLDLNLNRFLYNHFSDQIRLISMVSGTPLVQSAFKFYAIMNELTAERTDQLSNGDFYKLRILEEFSLDLNDPVLSAPFSHHQEHFAPLRLKRKLKTRPVAGAHHFINTAKHLGLKLILATNPVNPLEISLMRLSWAGFSAQDFCYITHFDNCTRTKPHKEYYQSILEACNLLAEECIMVGNDPSIDILKISQGKTEHAEEQLADHRQIEALQQSHLKSFIIDSRYPAKSLKSKRFCKDALKAGAFWAGHFKELTELLPHLR